MCVYPLLFQQVLKFAVEGHPQHDAFASVQATVQKTVQARGACLPPLGTPSGSTIRLPGPACHLPPPAAASCTSTASSTVTAGGERERAWAGGPPSHARGAPAAGKSRPPVLEDLEDLEELEEDQEQDLEKDQD